MAVLKCKMCGASLDVSAGMSVVECEYCGSTQTIPKIHRELNGEKKLTLFARAGRFLSACEFDGAANVYESIVSEFPDEAEGYWGLVLCRFGIEYVDDPATGRKVPTCHRSSFESVMDDENYRLALSKADDEARAQYRREGGQIEKLRRDIIEISDKEQPYDIFICYKETDEAGERTLDSVLAQDIYTQLTDEGYRVFFSRITLEDKLGTEYEPLIFAALNSAKIMLVVGTDPDYFNAVWVKNEWSRYLKLMAQDKNKKLIPCYKGIDPYDMPKGFARLQSQDMDKLGAMQDLMRGVEKIIGKKTPEPTPQMSVQAQKEAQLNNLLRRVDQFLEQGEWSKAESYCERILDDDPSNAEAFLKKTLIEARCRNVDELTHRDMPLTGIASLNMAMRYGDNAFKQEIGRLQERASENLYNRASSMMRNAQTEDQLKSAAELFGRNAQYRDSQTRISECRKRIQDIHDRTEAEQANNARKLAGQGQYATAINTLQAINGSGRYSDEIQKYAKKAEDAQADSARKLAGQGKLQDAIQTLQAINGSGKYNSEIEKYRKRIENEAKRAVRKNNAKKARGRFMIGLGRICRFLVRAISVICLIGAVTSLTEDRYLMQLLERGDFTNERLIPYAAFLGIFIFGFFGRGIVHILLGLAVLGMTGYAAAVAGISSYAKIDSQSSVFILIGFGIACLLSGIGKKISDKMKY